MLRDTSVYEILYDLPEGSYRPGEVGGIRTRTVRAGNTVEVECYPLIRLGATQRQRCESRRQQRECQEKLNRRNAEKKIRRMTEHNFTQEDWFGTLTWDYGRIDRFTMSQAEAQDLWEELRLPVEEEDARRELNNYFRRIKTRMRQRGEDPAGFKHIYVLELTRPRTDGYWHYHFHLVLHAPGLSDRELKDLWGQGFARFDRLSWQDEGPARLAHYLTKQHTTEAIDRRGRRLRRWGHSKNLKAPVERVSDRKLSRRRAQRIAEDVARNGVEIFERLYPGYKCVQTPEVRFSDYVPGAYIYARLRKIEDAPPWERTRKRGNRGTSSGA